MERLALLVLASFFALGIVPQPAAALSLLGTADPIPLPSPNPPVRPPFEAPTLVSSGGFLTGGHWNAPALPDWQGTFTATGPIPSGANPVGTTFYDFTTLPSGHLPSGTIMTIGDLDGGSGGTEAIILRAYDASNAPILSMWLTEPYWATTGASSQEMPSSLFDPLTGTYDLLGSGVTAPYNPSIGFDLLTDVDIAYLEVTRGNGFENFAVSAPVPEPGTAALLGLGAAGLALHRRWEGMRRARQALDPFGSCSGAEVERRATHG